MYKHFESICYEERYVYPPADIDRLTNIIKILNDGTVEIVDYDKNTNDQLKASVEDVEKLHKDIMDFIDNIFVETIYTDDTSRTITVNYRFVSVVTCATATDKDFRVLKDILKDFIENKCTK